MQFNDNLSQEEKASVIKKIIPITIWLIIIGISVYFVKDQEIKVAAGKDIIRCIIDENASDLGSPSCKRVINKCSNDKTGICKKLLFYTDDGVHSEEALSILGNICSKGGENACDILINRCIENSSNCEILGKSYSIKNYLAMKSNVKNTGKTVMYKKLKTYYDKDVDNIVSSVIQTCINDKSSMACQIFTSKTYSFNNDEKPYFIIIQNSGRELAFSKTGIVFLTNPALNNAEKKKKEEKETLEEKENLSIVDLAKTKEEADKTSEISEIKPVKKIIPVSLKEKSANKQDDIKTEEQNNSEKIITETPPNNEDLSNNINDKKEILKKKQPAVTFKSIFTTGEENNIDYIKNKIYSFDIEYKEPANTKIRWLVSFDGRNIWKKWDGKSWIQTNTDSGLENVNFSAIANTSAEIINGLKDYTLKNGETSLDFAVELISHDEISTPSIDRVEIKYH